jgi:glyoxylase-like metal-dependent hydrolase (beta-lactamase superfamily II)
VSALVRTADERGTSVDVAKEAGIYPADYQLEPCPVEWDLGDGERVAVGDLFLECIYTPGHASGHLSYLLDHGGRRSLFAGDVVFHGGGVLLQNLYDCSLAQLAVSLRRLRGLDIDALLPGHLAFSVNNGQRHIERANEALDRLLIPNQVASAW